ncbi:MAG: hypothetical protein ACJ72H_15440 [Candidatus Sulfotelmatobacter sp.]
MADRWGLIAVRGLDGIVEGVRELGHVEGKDFVVEWPYAEEKYERITRTRH